MIRKFTLAATVLAALSAPPAAAQPRRAPSVADDPQLPPATCRVWHRGLPADRQPPPTDCATARRQAAITGGEVIATRTEAGGAFRFSDSADSYRRETDARRERERERERRERAYDERMREIDRSLRCVDEVEC
jgi:hypothetical protein